jgi:hypothetical protein
MGQQLTTSRIALFNRNGRSPMQIRDLKDASGEAAGTEVIVTIQTPNLL